MGSALEVASLFGVLSLDNRASSELERFGSGLDSTEARMRQWGRTLTGLGGVLTGLTAPLVNFGRQGIQTASNFEAAMAEIGARAGLTGDALQQVADFALEMGAQTSFSAQEAADAFLQLLTSGQTVEQAIATLPSVLDGAAASGEDLGQTADLVTNILASFQLGVEDAAMVVDALARAAGASSADMGSLGQGFSNVGGVAAQFGLSVEETAAILAVFAENGIAGSEAGTLLKSMLLSMNRGTKPVTRAWNQLGTSLYDATGTLRPLAEVLKDITAATSTMSDEERNAVLQDLGSTYGIVGLAALTSSIDIETMQAAMENSASATEVAQARLDTYAGRMEALSGAIETLQIRAMTPFMDSLKPTIEAVTSLVNRISDWVVANPQLTDAIIKIVAAVAALGAGLSTVGGFMILLAPLAPLLGLFGSLLVPIGLIGAAVAGLYLAWKNNFLGIQDITEPVVSKVRGWLSELPDAVRDFGTVDMSGISTSIQSGLTGLEFGDVQSIFETHFDSILGLIGTAAALIFGGPIGWAITGAQLVASAIENDFLGLGTFLQESGISAAVETAFNDVKTEIERVWGEVLALLNLEGGGENPLQGVIDWFIGTGDDSFLGAISQVGTWVDEQILAPLRGIWIVAGKLLRPLAEWWQTTFLPALQQVAGWIDTSILTPLRDLWTDLQPILTEVAGFVTRLFQPVIDIISTALDSWEMLRRIGGGTPERALPGEIRPGWQRTDSAGISSRAGIGGSRGISSRFSNVGFGVPGFADGGAFGPGWAVVGEKGPELVQFGKAGRVYSNRESQQMLGGGGVTIGTVNVMLPAEALKSPEAARARGRDFADGFQQRLREKGGLA